MSDYPDLLPCPFCGSQAAMSVLVDEPDEILSAWISCPCGVEIHERRTEKEAAMAWNARATPEDRAAIGDRSEYFEMLWNWFEDESRIGSDGMRPERREGLSADDFKTMLDEHEAALTASTDRAAIIEGATVAEDDLARVLYEAEYDAELYPWEKASSSEQLTYKTQAEAALSTFKIRARSHAKTGEK